MRRIALCLTLCLTAPVWATPNIGISLWRAVPLVTSSLASASNPGGEGCQQVEGMAWDSAGVTGLFCTDVGGLWETHNSGNSWYPANVGFLDIGGGSCAIDPNNASVQLVASSGVNSTSQTGLWLSTSAGASWTEVLVMADEDDATQHEQIAFDPASSSGGHSVTAYWDTTTAGIYRTTNSCTTWSQVNTGYSNGILKVAPTGSDVYVGAGTTFAVSTNFGSSFTNVSTAATISGLDVCTASPADVVISVPAVGVSQSTNNGTSFSAITKTGLPTLSGTATIFNIKYDPSSASTMLVNFNNASGCTQYSLVGSSWVTLVPNVAVSSFMPLNSRLGGFAWAPSTPPVAWQWDQGDFQSTVTYTSGAATELWANNLYNAINVQTVFNFTPGTNDLLVTSEDYNSATTGNANNVATTWLYQNPPNQGFGGFNYGGVMFNPTTIYVGNTGSPGGTVTLFATTNSGSTWAAVSGPITMVGTTANSFPGLVDPVTSADAYWGKWLTTNTGGAWSVMTGCLGVFTYNYEAPATLYGGDGITVTVSGNHGSTWAAAATLTASNDVIDVAYDWKNAIIYSCSNQGLLFSTKGGTTTNITTKLPADSTSSQGANTVAVNPLNPNIVYAGWFPASYNTNSAVMVSYNAGVSWAPLIMQPGDLGTDGGHNAVGMRVNPYTGYLWSAGAASGIWRYPPPPWPAGDPQ